MDWYALVKPMKLETWEVELSHFPEWQWVRPFEGWKAAERPPSWWTANNKLKHEPWMRWKANLEAAVAAVCAVRILLTTEFGPGVDDLLPPLGLADIKITRKPDWYADEVYFPPLAGAALQAVPVFGLGG